jgi:ATP synthase protein I
MGDGKKHEAKNDPSFGRNLLWMSTLGINLVLSSAVGVVIGLYLDKWLKTQPVMTILFFLVGTFAGFRQIYREIRKLGSEEEKQHERNK